jgi:hypothetical protein
VPKLPPNDEITRFDGTFCTLGVETLASGFASLAADLQIPTSLKEVGITEADLSLLSTEAMKVRFATCLQEVSSLKQTSVYSLRRP